MSERIRRTRRQAASVAAVRPCTEALEARVLLAFGLTTTSSSYTVDTGANLVFSVKRTTGSGAVGDINSISYNGIECEAPFSSTSRHSHYASGLSSSTAVSAAVIGDAVLVTCNDLGGTGVIMYYIARQNENNIYMATYAPGPNSPSPGEMRFITYLNWGVFANHPIESDTSAIHGTNQVAIESTDVFRDPVDGHTHSKYYGEHRAIDAAYYGTTGTSGANTVGAFMFIGNRETSSGGPFYKDIDFQSTGAAVELYNYTFSGHSQTEAFRPGLKGPYALQLTDGSAPTPVDYSFIDGLGLTGWVGPAGRGTLTGTATGVPSGFDVTVGLSNATAQYWGIPDGSGNYTINGILPGTYTQKLYQDELVVGTQTVTVTAGNTTTASIVDTYNRPGAIWRIGAWDGTPLGFLNADKITIMHPSDPRMAPWVNTTYTVGTSTDGDWPMAEFKDASITSTNRITFNLTSAEVGVGMTLRIGITWAQAGGRPIISVNGGSYSSAPAISPQPSSRGFTLGNWRGNNFLYTYNISAGALHAGTNTIDIRIASGSGGTAFLSPAVIFDALDLVPNRPIAPSGLVAQSISNHEIDLVTWNASPGATSYNVKRSQSSGGAYTTIATGVTTTSYQDPTLSGGTNYYYVVSAVNAGGEGLNSGEASAQTFPDSPTGLSASAASATEIDLAWTGSFGATSYNVKRASLSGGPYTTIATGISDTTFSDTTVSGGIAYFYVVSAVDSGGESLNSAEAMAVTPPAAPTGLSASVASANEIDLVWTGSVGATSYSIKRSETLGGPYTSIDSAAGTSYSDTSVVAARRYYYVVSAVGDGGESTDSEEAIATTPPAAVPDSYTVEQNNILRANDINGTVDGSGDDGVLVNDLAAPGNALTAVLVTSPSHGILVFNSDGSVKYTPDEDFIGTDTFTYKAYDGAAYSDPATVQIEVTRAVAGARLIPDPCGAGTAVLVNGTSGNDTISVRPSCIAGAYQITLNCRSLGVFAVQRIIIHGEAGDDRMQVSGCVATPVWMFGESGDDHLNAGNGGSVVVGGSGNDELLGGGGRDVLIGGLGADHMVGNAGDDILIAGRSDFDQDLDALCDILDEWMRTDANFVTRVEHLKGIQAGGLNGTTFLNSSTVHDDDTIDQIDILVGSSGDDWFIYSIAGGDRANGVSKLESGEALTNI